MAIKPLLKDLNHVMQVRGETKIIKQHSVCGRRFHGSQLIDKMKISSLTGFIA